MLRNRRERGEGQFGCLVGLVVVLIAGLIAYKMIPVKVKAADLRDTVIDSARSAGQMSENAIRKTIIAKADALGLPVTDKDIWMKKSSTEIKIRVTYTVPVEFPGYTYHWSFKIEQENPIF